eukprot:m.5860 g.5860  ORF g.5860 m.5860 type:complete len:255 (+) comp4706_c0_seq2:104-868(+)
MHHETWGDHDVEVQKLHKAVKNDDLDSVEKITEKLPDIIDVMDSNGFSPLMNAASKGGKELVDHLLKNGADKDFETFSHKTPLMVACTNGHIEVAEKLINAGANVHAYDKGGVPIIHHAVDSKQTLLIEYLIKAGVNVDERDHAKEWTPLMRCAGTFGDVHMARALVHYGADVNSHDKTGLTPLMLATNGGFKKLVRFLLSAGADAKKPTKHGVTPQQVAMTARNAEIVDIIDHPPPIINEDVEAKRVDTEENK